MFRRSDSIPGEISCKAGDEMLADVEVCEPADALAGVVVPRRPPPDPPPPPPPVANELLLPPPTEDIDELLLLDATEDVDELLLLDAAALTVWVSVLLVLPECVTFPP
jgi:hypothetical protein